MQLPSTIPSRLLLLTALTLTSHTLAAPLPQNDPVQTLENRTPSVQVQSEDVPDLSWVNGNAKRAALQKFRASDTVHWIDGTDLEKREPNLRAAAETDPDLAFVDENGNPIHKREPGLRVAAETDPNAAFADDKGNPVHK